MRLWLACLFIASLLCLPKPALAADPAGLWLTQDGESKLRIAPCGNKLCGTLAWLKVPSDSKGQPLLDASNPDPAQRARPLLGVQILLGLAPAGEGWKGKFYNPEDGKTYDGSFVLSGSGKAEINACIAVVLCQTEVLVRQ